MKRIIVLCSILLLLVPFAAVAQSPCEGNFDCDLDVDGSDASVFKSDFGRSSLKNPCPTCGVCSGGTLSPLGRWCDQLNGTVKDMTTGLVWLKDAGWGGQYAFWVNTMNGVNAQDRAAQLWDGSPYEGTAGLSDGSVEGEWRLPTKTELAGITVGDEYIRSSSMYFFTGVQSYSYWSGTSYVSYPLLAWCVDMHTGFVGYGFKDSILYVWPVRSDH